MTSLIVIGFFVAIVYQLGAGLYHMVNDADGSRRMVAALTRRVALSVALILLLLAGIATGVVQPHGIAG